MTDTMQQAHIHSKTESDKRCSCCLKDSASAKLQIMRICAPTIQSKRCNCSSVC